MGCDQWEETFQLDGVSEIYRVPAALLQVRVDDLENEDDSILEVLSSMQKTIDLRSVVYEQSDINKERSEESINESVITGDMENKMEEEDQQAVQALDIVRYVS